jgi:RNA exonuclease 1
MLKVIAYALEKRGEMLQCILETFVKPDNPITDYNTRYSGITADMLKDVKTRLPDVIVQLRSIFSAETILVGHSLNSDFTALGLLHGRVIDTVHLFPHPQGLPHRSALRILAERCVNLFFMLLGWLSRGI